MVEKKLEKNKENKDSCQEFLGKDPATRSFEGIIFIDF